VAFPMHDRSVLLVPGLGGSSAGHWQALWAGRNSGFEIVEQADWDAPEPEVWADALNRAVERAGRPVVLVAHSLGCALVARWAGTADEKLIGAVAGALLVAPADVDARDRTPDVVRGFAPMPLDPLPFPSVVVASRDDPYVASDRAKVFAARWGSTFRDVGACGHINTDSGHGPWPEGRAILDDFLMRVSEYS